jgi:predicted acyltransferase
MLDLLPTHIGKSRSKVLVEGFEVFHQLVSWNTELRFPTLDKLWTPDIVLLEKSKNGSGLYGLELGGLPI